VPIENTLNVSEFLKRLGVVGDSAATMPMLEALRLTVNLGDFSDLVPPVGTPFAAASVRHTSPGGQATFFQLFCGSPGGLMVTAINAKLNNEFDIWVSDSQDFGALAGVETHEELAFGQTSLSVVSFGAGAKVSPASAVRTRGTDNAQMLSHNWIGPGQFFNCEAVAVGVTNHDVAVSWKEYPGGINP